ncbi:MAG: 1-acyl-sn-glycerol-3-phosphate acyltransferase [Bacilli bacterium]|nr:1-acyl-sn-glycerol-3-phosphate acyltransferase [Bacilli bacterium]
MKIRKRIYLIPLKFIIRKYYLWAFNVKYEFVDFDPKREGPFFLIGNHVLLLDAFFSNFPINGYAIPVTNSFVYTSPIQKFALTKLIDSIVKRKGQSDIQTIKDMRRFIKQGKSIAIYPEGNTSYYGDTTESIFTTAKLFKSQKIDVICSKTKGGYFAKPRWRKSRTKKPYIEISMSTLFTVNDLEKMSVEEIFNKMTSFYYNNDYEWNRIHQHKYIGKNRLLGSHRVIYGCPNCNSVNTLDSFKDTIFCTSCDMKGTINDFGFIEGTKYDNFVDWGEFQENLLRSKLDAKLEFEIEFYKFDMLVHKKYNLGKKKLTYENSFFYIDNKYAFDIIKIKGEAYTERKEFSFDYLEETYMFFTEKPKLLLDLTRIIKEEK